MGLPEHYKEELRRTPTKEEVLNIWNGTSWAHLNNIALGLKEGEADAPDDEDIENGIKMLRIASKYIDEDTRKSPEIFQEFKKKIKEAFEESSLTEEELEEKTQKFLNSETFNSYEAKLTAYKTLKEEFEKDNPSNAPVYSSELEYVRQFALAQKILDWWDSDYIYFPVEEDILKPVLWELDFIDG